MNTIRRRFTQRLVAADMSYTSPHQTVTMGQLLTLLDVLDEETAEGPQDNATPALRRIYKFNGGHGAVLCNGCGTIVCVGIRVNEPLAKAEMSYGDGWIENSDGSVFCTKCRKEPKMDHGKLPTIQSLMARWESVPSITVGERACMALELVRPVLEEKDKRIAELEARPTCLVGMKHVDQRQIDLWNAEITELKEQRRCAANERRAIREALSDNVECFESLADDVAHLVRERDMWKNDALTCHMVLAEIRDWFGLTTGWNSAQWPELLPRIKPLMASRDTALANLNAALQSLQSLYDANLAREQAQELRIAELENALLARETDPSVEWREDHHGGYFAWFGDVLAEVQPRGNMFDVCIERPHHRGMDLRMRGFDHVEAAKTAAIAALPLMRSSQ